MSSGDHQVWWIDKKEFIALKAELYDEDGYLVRSEKASDLKIMDGRLIPTLLELVPAENEGYKTILKIVEIKFNIRLKRVFLTAEYENDKIKFSVQVQLQLSSRTCNCNATDKINLNERLSTSLAEHLAKQEKDPDHCSINLLCSVLCSCDALIPARHV